MIISHRKRFVLFLPWKTASQTMLQRLERYNDSQYSAFFYFNSHLNRVVHQHITCADFACLPESKLGYFAASFVRNPYDRVYSGFRQLLKDAREQLQFPYPEPWIRDHVATQLADNLQQLCHAKFHFDAWLELVRDEQIYEIGRNTNFPLHPSHYWTHLAGDQVVNFIGRVENFEADFQELLTRLQIDEAGAGNANVSDLEGNAAHNPCGYRYVDRMGKRSIRKINRLFARDFELFHYQPIETEPEIISFSTFKEDQAWQSTLPATGPAAKLRAG